MRSFGEEAYINYKYENRPAAWMRAERLEYCEQTAPKSSKGLHLIVQMLLSIFA